MRRKRGRESDTHTHTHTHTHTNMHTNTHTDSLTTQFSMGSSPSEFVTLAVMGAFPFLLALPELLAFPLFILPFTGTVLPDPAAIIIRV